MRCCAARSEAAENVQVFEATFTLHQMNSAMLQWSVELPLLFFNTNTILLFKNSIIICVKEK